MDTGMTGWLIGAGIIAVQIVFIYALGKILTIFTNHVLPDSNEK